MKVTWFRCKAFFGMLRTTDAAARSRAMNYGCWYAIVRSEKTHTLARNEFQVLMCHHAVRKDTHAGLACNECFGMQWITGPQRIPSADVPSCGQKRHTRWPATNASACNECRMRFSTREFCQITNASACELAPAWTSKQQSDVINYQVLDSLRVCG